MADAIIVISKDKEIRGKEFQKGKILCTCNMEREVNASDLMKAILLREVGVVEIKNESKQEKQTEGKKGK